jgi:probable rRNA maturation factor
MSNTYTDIITFPMSYEPIESDIFISIDRIGDNADDLKVSFENELHRVIIHGVLHLIGYDDKTDEAQSLMTQKENEYLSKRLFL